MSDATPQKMHYIRPTIEKVTHTSSMLNRAGAMSDFNIRLTVLKKDHPEWTDTRNQNRPFKASFIEFIENLLGRLPVTPVVVPTVEGNVLFRFKKHAPKDQWQVMEITITPQRTFEMIVKSRNVKQEPFRRTNIAKPDILSDAIRMFYEHDGVTSQEHPIRYRKATSIDYPVISGMALVSLGAYPQFGIRKIKDCLEYAVVAEDPMYGIISVAGIGKHPDSGEVSNFIYQVNLCITLEPFRGLGICGKCLRKAIANLLIDKPDARVTAAVQMEDDATRDECRGILTRSGFQRVKIVSGESIYHNFLCDRCNLDRCLCGYDEQDSVCSTVYYELGDRGGKNGYGGKKKTE